jgi:hypothetical protein
MTTNDAFERNLSLWLHEDAEHHVPEHLAAVLQRTATARQRPAWSSLERWLPVNITVRRSEFDRPVPFGQIGLLFVIGLLIAAFVAIAVGSHRTPSPYGLARNGAIVASHDGDIYALDPASSAASVVIGGDSFDFAPTFSRDGTQFLFLRAASRPADDAPALLTLMVANANGSGVRALTDPLEELAWFDWSPNGAQIAYVAEFGNLSVVNLDGSGSITLDVGQSAHFVTWLPPDGSEILFRRGRLKLSDPRPGIFAVRPDGTGLRQISETPSNNDFDFMGLTVAPDGSRVSYSRYSSRGTPSAIILDLRTGEERVLPGPKGTAQSGGAVFSPDGTLIVYSRIYANGDHQLILASSDGSSEGTALGPRMSGPTEGSTSIFTPDGSAVIAGYGQDDARVIYRLPVDGSPGSVLTQSASFSFTDVQRLAP